ncbi:MAG: hypothetical protein EOO77_27385 [Oxalobacteraceae bacterium]|nr:MAG: hypothetical protein EOO77_27385 [Oxalobacteraceae bacterium]
MGLLSSATYAEMRKREAAGEQGVFFEQLDRCEKCGIPVDPTTTGKHLVERKSLTVDSPSPKVRESTAD